MTARTHLAHRRWVLGSLAALLHLLTGCHGLLDKHHERKIPQYGVIDPHQPRELEMVSLPPYTIEPPDELEVTVRPGVSDLTSTNLTVQADGNLDLGFLGDVYVAGLTLEQAEIKIAQQLMVKAGSKAPKDPYDVSVRLVNSGTSKAYYVLGTVTTQGRFPITGNETVLDAILLAGL